jgi:hypothetical protein
MSIEWYQEANMWRSAKFEWLSKEQGGRKTPPTGTSYFATTHSLGDLGWSICLDLLENRITLASSEAPFYKLVDGFVLDIMEGARKVGTATILEEDPDAGIEVPKAGTRAVDELKKIADENCMDVPKAVVRKLDDDIVKH